MTNSELKAITSMFDDIKPLIEERKHVLKQTNKIRRRLKTKVSEYNFLLDLVEINSNGSKLVDAVVSLFKSIGFKHIENVDKKYKEEDIRLFTDNILLIIEVTGIDNATPKFSKAHQISMHIPKRQSDFEELNVFGAFIINHDNKKYFKNRHKKPFTLEIQEISKSHKYSLITTVELLNDFINFKKGLITRNEILNKLCVNVE